MVYSKETFPAPTSQSPSSQLNVYIQGSHMPSEKSEFDYKQTNRQAGHGGIHL
jgi:hypothetical protein